MLHMTSPRSQNEQYRTVSGPLVNAVTAGFSAGISARFKAGVAGKVIAALLSVPICFIIVLLSPPDVYLASGTLLKQF